MKQIRRTASVPGQPKASDRWRTPRPMFDALNAEFSFDLDAAASEHDHLCDRWLGPGGLAEDALAVRWADFGRRVWLNCPYSSALIRAFLKHASAQAFDGLDLLVTLTPHDTSTKWWDHLRWSTEIREMPHRVPYLREDGVTPAGAMFASAVTIFRPQPGIIRAQPRRVVWTWRQPIGAKR